MAQEHEYALLGGFNRAKVGRYLSLLAAAISSGIVFMLLALVDIARQFGLATNLPPVVLSLAGAGAVYAVLYWFFDRFAWKLAPVARLLKVPNLSGDWRCEGQSINPDKTPGIAWSGTVTIVQSWDKLRVRLRTSQSGSNSIAASLVDDAADGFRLMYNYRNEPRIGEADLQAHHGFAEITFCRDCRSGIGEYFNGRGRYTFGTMTLTKEVR